MKKIIFFIFLCLVKSSAQEVKVSTGSLKFYENFKSEFVDARNVGVWLPNNYSSNDKYPVLYLHDGAMLFDASTTWNKKSWEVDETFQKLIDDNKIEKCIIVGIWNNGDFRHSEYFPEKMIESIPESTRKKVVEEQLRGKPQGDNYLKFIVSELKPFVDKTFSTKADKPNTYIGGASMGGLISLYAMCEYPEVFGNAICMSTHLPMTRSEKLAAVVESDLASKFRDYLVTNLPNAESHKLYMDFGDQTIDAYYKFFQDKVDAVLIQKGYSDKNWTTKFFSGDDHSETSWARRLNIPLLFMLGK
jgi:predicted alpha/beta superfamily hydrolase